ncbi:MAG: Crp/Fnr family transcriptional regulator [Deltaproteobacteria bacterium]|nr:Crp/Fnr family transcriptional regulator [Deltaproteobacteria bacterium]
MPKISNANALLPTEGAVLELVKQHALLRAFDAARLVDLLQRCEVRRFVRNRTILRSGDPAGHVMFLLSGAARVFYRAPEGNELLVKLFKAPAMMAEMEVLAGIPMMPCVRTIRESNILYMPGDIFRNLVDTDVAFAANVARDLATRLCVASDRQRAMGLSDVESRLASLLVDYATLEGVPFRDGVLISYRLSQECMAKDLAVSRKWVNAVLRKFKAEGLIAKVKARYWIPDVSRLGSKCPRSLLATHRVGAQVAGLRTGGHLGSDRARREEHCEWARYSIRWLRSSSR